MISEQVNEVSFAQYANEVLSDMGERLLKQQSGIASTYLNRTGWLADRLASGIYLVTQTDDGANMVINYPDYIRFLDLKKTKTGRMKKVYHPIYNRPLYGYVYGYAFARLRAGLNQGIRDGIVTEGTLQIEVSV